MVVIQYPERVPLAHLPTPVVHLARTSAALGVEMYLKRDDMTGVELSGNKVRKLEFLLADAVAQGADTLITCGGEQSNHCRATAMSAAKLGMRAMLLLRTETPTTPPHTTGNILLDRLAGAEIAWISHAEYQQRAILLEREAERLRKLGAKPYIIPEGGSNAVGAWGYIAAMDELIGQLKHLPTKTSTIVYATGSGGTGAGLILGAKLLGLSPEDIRIVGINVCDNEEYFINTISGICRDFSSRYGIDVDVQPSDIRIIDGYVGRGYAKSRPEELELLRDLVRREGIVLDPVYTGKAFYGLSRELARDPASMGQRIIFLHTGGIFGLFPKAAQVEPLL